MSVDWIRMGREIANMPNGVAVLRVMQAHGIFQLGEFKEGKLAATCSLDMVIDYAHKEKSLG